MKKLRVQEYQTEEIFDNSRKLKLKSLFFMFFGFFWEGGSGYDVEYICNFNYVLICIVTESALTTLHQSQNLTSLFVSVKHPLF